MTLPYHLFGFLIKAHYFRIIFSLLQAKNRTLKKSQVLGANHFMHVGTRVNCFMTSFCTFRLKELAHRVYRRRVNISGGMLCVFAGSEVIKPS